MSVGRNDELRQVLETKKTELATRLERINANVRRGYEADSKERAKQLEDNEVVDALGNEARQELAKISAAMQRLEAGLWDLYRVRNAHQTGPAGSLSVRR